MTTKYLTGSYTGPYVVGANYTNVTVALTAYIGGGVGAGLISTSQYIGFYNAGMIKAGGNSVGVQLYQGGSLTNVGTIMGGGGGYGVAVRVKGAVYNAGLIEGGTSPAHAGPGVYAGAGVYLNNTGTILGGDGANLAKNSNYNPAIGGTGVYMYDSTDVSQKGVNQAGLIQGGSGGSYIYGEQGGEGVRLFGSIDFLNQASIVGGVGGGGAKGGGLGGTGVKVRPTASMFNTGRITGGQGGAASAGVGGTGGYGAFLAGASLTNSGTITGGAEGVGVSGKSVAPLSPGGPSSSYVSGGGVGVVAQHSLVINSGLIHGGAGASAADYGGNGGTGIYLFQSPGLTNSGTVIGGEGAAGAMGAGRGGIGVKLYSYQGHDNSVTNTGVILGGGSAGGAAFASDGVYASGDSNLVNGAANALISGYYGVADSGYGALTVTNYGTIAGSGAADKSVIFKSTADRLIAEAGAVFEGAIVGGRGTLELAGPDGTITGLGGVGALSGGVSGDFSGFASYTIDGGGTWTIAGGGVLAAGQTLTFEDELVNAGDLRITGGKGTVFAGLIAGAHATLSGGGTIGLNANGYIGGGLGGSLTNVDETIIGNGGFIFGPGAFDNQAAGVIDATGRMVVQTAGTLSNAGTIEATGKGDLIVRGTTVENAGGLIEDHKTLQVQNATLDGGTVSVASGGRLISTGVSVIDGASLSNAGILGASGGSLTIDGDLTNDDLLRTLNGDLTITGAVSGTGRARLIGSGALELDGAFAQRVIFNTGSTSALVIGDVADFTGVIVGLSKTGTNQIDLKFITYVASDTLHFTPDKLTPTVGGTLTFSDDVGDVLATLKLAGNYTASTFTFTQGIGGSTAITDPRAKAFTSAMAGLVATGGSGTAAEPATPAEAFPRLASPTANPI